MNVLLDSHAIRPFSHAIACLTKIGKDVVIEATPSALTLRTLNDSQSAYITVTFNRDFFIECNNHDLSVSGSSRFRKRQRTGASSSSSAFDASQRDDDGDDTDDADNDGDGGGFSYSSGDPKDASSKFVCKTSLKSIHGILKRSRQVHTLRISSSSPSYQPATKILTSTQSSDPPGPDPAAATQLVFEFSCPLGVRKIHRIGLQAADNEWIVEDPKAAQQCSGLSCHASALIELLEPVAKSAELVVTFTETECKAQSFDHFTKGSKNLASATAANGGAAAPTADSLKTESSMAVEDFQHYDFRTDRDGSAGAGAFQSSRGGGKDSTDGDDGSASAARSEAASAMPSDVNEKVSLVFTTKELKALMVFCQGVSKPVEDDETYRPVKPLVECSFAWGGRPIVFKCTDLDDEGGGGKWEVMLILASRDWTLLEA